jgi:hypothetical protein
MFNQTSESPMCDVVLQEDIAYECSSLSQQITGQSRDINKNKTHIKQHTFVIALLLREWDAFVSEHEV